MSAKAGQLKVVTSGTATKRQKSLVNWDDVVMTLLAEAKKHKGPVAYDQRALQVLAWNSLKVSKEIAKQTAPKKEGAGPVTDNALRNAMLWRVAEHDKLRFIVAEGRLCVRADP